MTAGPRIKEYIESKGISQTFLGRRAGIPIGKLNQTLNGNRRFQLDEYERICWALEVPADTFLKPHPPEPIESYPNQ